MKDLVGICLILPHIKSGGVLLFQAHWLNELMDCFFFFAILLHILIGCSIIRGCRLRFFTNIQGQIPYHVSFNFENIEYFLLMDQHIHYVSMLWNTMMLKLINLCSYREQIHFVVIYTFLVPLHNSSKL